jgi:uncharacterized protein (TIGR03437 family)
MVLSTQLGTPQRLVPLSLFSQTGEGQTNPPGNDGLVADKTLPKPVLPVSVTIDGQVADVLYFGAAPQEIAGLMQINVRIPLGTRKASSVPVVALGRPEPKPIRFDNLDSMN